MLQQLKNFIENRGEMLQSSDISAENLPLAALSAHYCEKICGGQPGMAIRRVLFCRQHNGKFRTPARLRNHSDIAALPRYDLAGQIQANAKRTVSSNTDVHCGWYPAHSVLNRTEEISGYVWFRHLTYL